MNPSKITGSDKDNLITIQIGDNTNFHDTLYDKAAFLLTYANVTNDQELFDRIKNVIEIYTDTNVLVTQNRYIVGEGYKILPLMIVANNLSNIKFDKIEDIKREITEESFSHFMQQERDESRHESLYKSVESIISTDENIKLFIFSDQDIVKQHENSYDADG